MAPAWTRIRSTGSSISLRIGSSVRTQFCSTLADTLPETRNPSPRERREIERGFKPRQRQHADRVRHGLPDGFVGLEFHMTACGGIAASATTADQGPPWSAWDRTRARFGFRLRPLKLFSCSVMAHPFLRPR